MSSIERFHCIQDSQLGPNGVLYREVPLYTGQPAGSQKCPLSRGSTVHRTASWVPKVSSIEGSTVYRTVSWVPKVPSIERFHCIQDSQLGPNGVLYREVPLYTGQPAGSQKCPLSRGSTVHRTASWVPKVSSIEGSTVYRTASWVPKVPSIERFHCIQDSQLGPNGVLYREVPLYTGQPAGSQKCPLSRGSTVHRTASWVPKVSSIERFHCIQDSQLGPKSVLYREVALYVYMYCILYIIHTWNMFATCSVSMATLITPLSQSHRIILWSSLPDARSDPSGEKLIVLTHPL